MLVKFSREFLVHLNWIKQAYCSINSIGRAAIWLLEDASSNPFLTNFSS